MKRLTVIGLIIGLLMVLAVGAFAANVPQIINYQGTLTDKNGAPVPNGNYKIAFKIYSTPTGGAPLWSEKRGDTNAVPPTLPVSATNGLFNVMLGAVNPLPASFFTNYPKTYLGVSVENDTEMLPRQPIASVGYSFAAGNGMPKGGIIMWSGALGQIPDGWALCDGTNGTPDLRDRFVVGAGSSYAKGQTGGEPAHVLTVAEMPSHSHTLPGKILLAEQSSTGLNSGLTNSGLGYTKVGAIYDSSPGASLPNTGGGQSHNNLPPYYALAFIMKL